MKSKILAEFPHHQIDMRNDDIYIADYSNQTNNRRTVEIQASKPDDIDCFYIANTNHIELGICIFNHDSFLDADGNSLTQCECISFPASATIIKPWVLFLELKYCLFKNATKKLNEAKKQVFATMNYYKLKEIIEHGQLCYLIVSLPQQNNSPFENFIMTPAENARLRKEEKIIFKGVNEISINEDHIDFNLYQ